MTFEERFGPLRPRVRELRAASRSFREISMEVGCSVTTAWRLADDDHEARYVQSTRDSMARRMETVA